MVHFGTATATDVCGTVTITSVDGAIVSDGCNRSRTRTFTATDGCLNTFYYITYCKDGSLMLLLHHLPAAMRREILVVTRLILMVHWVVLPQQMVVVL
jgi:hypothetical protein